MCTTLTINVDSNDIQWNGLYEIDENNPSNWYGIQSANGAWLRDFDVFWLLHGTNQELLTYQSQNDPDNYYTPIQVTKSWNSQSKNAYNVTIQCSNTYVPTP